MSQTDSGKPVEPVLAAIEPLWRKAISAWNFYWKMAWRPRLFAEEHIQALTALSIKNTVKHTLWIAAFWSALQSLVATTGGMLGAPKSDSPLESFGTTFVFITLFALQVVPMAAVLWLLTRKHATSISQTLMIYTHMFNLFLASTLLVFSVAVAIALPSQLAYHYIGGHSMQSWNADKSGWFWLLLLPLVLMAMTCFCAWARIFVFVAPNLLAGTIKSTYWQAFWRYCVSFVIGAIPYLFILGSIMSLMLAATFKDPYD